MAAPSVEQDYQEASDVLAAAIQEIDVILASAHTQGLADQAGEVGQSVVFACAVSGTPTSFEWRRYASQDDPDIGTRIYSIIDGNTDSNKYNINNQYDLQVKNIAVGDGGKYECFNFALNDKKHGFLTALDPPSFSLPTINVGDVLMITCTVHYGAHPAHINAPAKIPVIEIRVGGNVVHGLQDARPTEISTHEYRIRGNATFTASVSDHNANVTCSAVMSEPDVTVTSSKTLNVKDEGVSSAPVGGLLIGRPSISIWICNSIIHISCCYCFLI